MPDNAPNNMPEFCHSCAVPLDHPDAGGGPRKNYCKFCVDAGGNVKSYQQIFANITMWMRMWQPPTDDTTLAQRATDYMNAMPHWAK